MLAPKAGRTLLVCLERGLSSHGGNKQRYRLLHAKPLNSCSLSPDVMQGHSSSALPRPLCAKHGQSRALTEQELKDVVLTAAPLQL